MKLRFFLALLFVMAALVGAVAPAPAASLRPSVVVEGEIVKLGDIFEDAGPKANQPVLYSPAPGRSVNLNAAWLAEVARLFQVPWRPTSQYDHITVQRAGNLITGRDVMPMLRHVLTAQGVDPHADIELLEQRFEVNVPITTPTTIDIQNLTYDQTTHAFNAVVLVGGNDPGAQKAIIQGRTFATSAVPVLRRPMNAGQIIRADDIQTVYWRNDLLNPSVVTSANQIVGRSPQAMIPAGQPIRQGDTRLPILVSRDGQVVIRLQADGMTLTVQGKALDEGARGDVVRVQNMQSHKTIEATVVGPDLVSVSLGSQLAAN